MDFNSFNNNEVYNRIDRSKGCMMGAFVGDALGAALGKNNQ